MESTRKPQPQHWIADHPWYLVFAALFAVFAWWALGTRTQDHHVRASFDSAFNLVKGQDVQVDGLDVGKIGAVKYSDGRAIVDIGINDNRVWPLHVGTIVKSRWGTTIGSGTRRLDLIPGPKRAPAIPEGGIIDNRDTVAAVDVDQVLNTLTQNTRAHLKGMQHSVDDALTGRASALNQGLGAAPAAVQATRGVVGDIARDSVGLRGLVANGNRLTRTLAARHTALSDLVTVAAQTFRTFSQNSVAVSQTLHDLPGTLDQTTTTLARVDHSVGNLDALVSDLRPGAARLRPLALAARPALDELAATIPTALATVRTATRVAPDITQLLRQGQPFIEKAGPELADLSPMMACIRPYAPEAGGAIVSGGSWQQGYVLKKPGTQLTDFPHLSGTPPRRTGPPEGDLVRQHYTRPIVQASTTSVGVYPPGLTSEAFAKLSGKQYAMPRPPGLSAGHPFFMPQCGVGPDSLDPSKDPEQRP